MRDLITSGRYVKSHIEGSHGSAHGGFEDKRMDYTSEIAKNQGHILHIIISKISGQLWPKKSSGVGGVY